VRSSMLTAERADASRFIKGSEEVVSICRCLRVAKSRGICE
jgi:hypothetical protein